MIYDCVCANHFEYLSLLIKYRYNDTGISDGINKCDEEKTDGFTPLVKLLQSDFCDADWISLLLNAPNMDLNKRCKGKHPLQYVNNDEYRQLFFDNANFSL